MDPALTTSPPPPRERTHTRTHAPHTKTQRKENHAPSASAKTLSHHTGTAARNEPPKVAQVKKSQVIFQF